jgi:hypothetical protein
LINSETHLVDDVHAYLWNEFEIYRQLSNQHEVVYRHIPRTGDVIVLDGFLNSVAAGMARRREGFELFGEKYYGNALIIPAVEKDSRPGLSPEEVGRYIRFFSLESSHTQEAQSVEHAVLV